MMRIGAVKFSKTWKVAVRSGVVLLLMAGVFSCTACNPLYVTRAAYEQSKILLARENIEDALADPDVQAAEKEKLRLVLDSRQFAIDMGLNPGGSFTKYAHVEKDTLAWVLVASRNDSFSLHTWWFPIVGSVPYKGYFDREDADEAGRELEEDGYEPFIRGTDAFSTLGWFNDPVLSTTLKGSLARINNTVIHESVHSTVWIKNNVPFNESLANFVGSAGSVEFFEKRVKSCPDAAACELAQKNLEAAVADRDFQFEYGALIDELYAALERLYGDNELSREQKIQQRGAVFDRYLTPFRVKYPTLKSLQKINNAEIIQLKLYLSKLRLFEELFHDTKREWREFVAKMRVIAEEIERDGSQDPFKLLGDILGKGEDHELR